MPSTAVITGAANGLGKALAIELAARGYHLALIDIDASNLSALQSDLGKAAVNVTTHLADLANESEVEAVSKEIAAQHLNITMLINNAGIIISQPFQQMASSDFRHLMDVNFGAVVYCTRHFLPLLNTQDTTVRIVNIISAFAVLAIPDKSAYAASKAAVMAFTNTLKTELSDTSIRLSLVIPPPMDTMIVRRGKHKSEQKRQAEIVFMANKGIPPRLVAEKIVRAVLRGKYRITIGSSIWAMDLAARLFPSFLHSLIARYKKRIDFV